jgi:hypothetical protein
MSRKAKKNRSADPLDDLEVGPGIEFAPGEAARGSKQYNSWHWGHSARRVVDWKDKDMPRMLVECGKLVRLHVRAPRTTNSRHPRRRRDAMIEFSRSVSADAHVAYDPDHSHERLYLLVPKRQQATLKKRFWDGNTIAPRDLNDLAAIAGGKHGRKRDYPNVMCKPIGVLTGVVYYTAKKGDSPENGGSFYIHHVGELSAHYPFLCIDQKGRLWLAGGNYTSPAPGITD